MTAVRFARFLLLLTPSLGLLGAVAWLIARSGGPSAETSADAGPDNGGRLVVLVVFDQMRGDYLDRWKQHFGPDGFEKLKRDGVWFSNAHVPYAASSTGPGHASLTTGTTPSVHGIVENKWFDRGRGKVVTGATTDEPNDRVPSGGRLREKWEAIAPTRLLAPTVGDALKEQKKAGGRAYSLSLKDRSAVMMGGHESNGVYCFDSSNGEFHTSSYYRKSLPEWVDRFDQSRLVYRWSGKLWERSRPPEVYNGLGPDDVPGEGGRTYTGRRVFPHTLPAGDSPRYFDVLENTAFGNEFLWEFVKAAVDGERLGRNGTTDLLCVSFSSNDLVGHAFGPDSHEVLDVTLRSDQLTADLLAHLEQKVGRERVAVVVTADHGVCPLPEVSATKGHPDARRRNPSELLGGLEEHLDKVFGKVNDVPGQWIEQQARFQDCHPWVYLNRRTIEALDKTYPEVEAAAAAWLRERSLPLTIFTRTQLAAGDFPAADRDFGRMTRLSFHPDRSGDLYVIPPAYDLVLGAVSLGTDHGTPHEYDRHVPVLAYGAGVSKLGERKEAVSSLIVAPLVAKLLGVEPPAQAKEALPAVLVR